MNPDKSEVIIIGPGTTHNHISPQLGLFSTSITPSCRNLGVIFDSNLNFNQHVKTTVRSCFIQLHRISKIRSFLSPKNLEIVIHAFITSRLDYCNSSLLTKSNKRVHITPILASLHWLPVRFRIDFKILMITFKARMGLAPEYIIDCLVPYEPRRSLRSSGGSLLEIPRSRLKTKGRPDLRYQGPVALERPAGGDQASHISVLS